MVSRWNFLVLIAFVFLMPSLQQGIKLHKSSFSPIRAELPHSKMNALRLSGPSKSSNNLGRSFKPSLEKSAKVNFERQKGLPDLAANIVG